MAKKKQTFKTIMESRMRRGSLPQDSYASRKWYRQKAQRLTGVRGVRPKSIITKVGIQNDRTTRFLRGRLMLGKMFMFEYDPKLAKTLPHYDAFPLIFPFKFYKEGFHGINLHYLPTEWRAILMDNLYDLRTNEIISFHAFLNSLSDSFSPEWTQVNGYGRMDSVKIYNKTAGGGGTGLFFINPAVNSGTAGELTSKSKATALAIALG